MKVAKRLVVDGDIKESIRSNKIVEGAMISLSTKGRAGVNEKVVIKSFAFLNTNTGSIRVRGMTLTKKDMLRLLDNADLIRKVIAKDNLERSMKLLGVDSKKDLKKLISSM